MTDYPKLGDDYRPPKPNSERKCLLCDHAPAGIQFVQVNWFRGDDVRCPCCQQCKNGNPPAATLIEAKARVEGQQP